jgi:glycosyltransferase involved in cell wall biosynthesis
MGAENRLRVAHIITQLELGGAQNNTIYTVKHLDPAQYEPCLLCGPGGMLDDEVRHSHIPTYFIPTLARPINPIKDVMACLLLYRHLRHLQPDIVHTHSSKAGILGRIAAYFAGVPVIVHTFHGFGITPNQSPLVRRLFLWAEKICARLSSHLIFVSEDNRSEAAQWGVGTQTPNSLIRSGIVLNPQPVATTWESGDRREQPRTDNPGDRRKTSEGGIRTKLAIPADAWLVVYVGNFKPQKNPMDLAKVAECVLLQGRDVYFLLIGSGELEEVVKRYVADRGLESHVHMLGWRRRDDVPKILADANCFLLTSLWEGLPRALVEAFAARLPAVCYAVNGVRDILKDGVNGFSIPPGNVVLAAEKVLWLKAHPEEARQMGVRGRQSIEKEFDIDTMVHQQEQLYAKLFSDVPLKDYYKYHGSLSA